MLKYIYIYIYLKNLFNANEYPSSFTKKIKEIYPNGIWKDKHHKQESKDKIGLSNSKFVGEKSYHYGKIWITDGVVNKKIKKDDEIPFGFRRGRNIGRGY